MTSHTQADDRGAPRRRCRRRRAAFLSAAVLLLGVGVAPPVAGQEYGQWWWDALLGAESRDYDNQADGTPTGGTEESELRLLLGLNGYILDPNLGQFRVAVDTQLSRFGDVRENDSRRFSYEGTLRLFPRGAYVIDLFARDRRFDYSEFATGDAVPRLTLPDSSTTLGAGVRVRRGPLRGVRAGFEQTNIGFLEPGSGSENEGRAFVDWMHSGKRFQRHVRLERDERDFSTLAYRSRDLTLDFDQGGKISPRWDWNLFLNTIDRRLSFGEAASVDIDTVRLRNNLTRAVAGKNLVSVSYQASFLGSDSADRFSHLVQGRYVLRQWEHWQLAPFAAFNLQQLPGVTVSAPQAGLSATWQRRFKAFDLSYTQSVSSLIRQVSGEQAEDDSDASSFALGAGFSIGHGKESGLRKELELGVDLNRLREATETVEGLPDLGVGLNASSDEDRLRARIALRRRWERLRVDGFSEWTRQESSRGVFAQDFSIESLRHSLTLGGGRFSLGFNADQTDARLPGQNDQTIDSLSGSLNVRPWRFLSFTALYRVDERQVNLGPDIDGDRAELSVDLSFGAFEVRASILRHEEHVQGGRDRINEGLRWTISRRFGGWLPVVTGVRARGVVR